MPKRAVTVIALAGAVILIAGSASAGLSGPGTTTGKINPTRVRDQQLSHFVGAARSRQHQMRWWQHRLEVCENNIQGWQRQMNKPLSHFPARVLAASSVNALAKRTRLCREQSRRVLARYRKPDDLRDWLCIHRYEGAWNDSGAPYWGGLQMSYGFQQTYGGWLLQRKGTADHWTPLEQIWTAVRAYRIRGFHPWPNTARACGLL